MSAQAWLQIILTLLAIFLVSIPLGRYMARIVMGRPTKLDRIFDPIDNAIYFLIGRRVAGQAMTWRTYTIHMLVTNLAMAIIIYLVLSFQNWLPLNQLNFPAVDPLLAFNTAISFVTNTNWQAYGGESTLSNFSQMGAITFAMFTSATTGFVVAMAWIRAFTVRNGGADLGNFYRDFIRFITRVLMPICFLVALFMIAQGAVQTFDASVTAHTLQGADQTIVVGPVASQGTIELIGTNGGGFYNANVRASLPKSDAAHKHHPYCFDGEPAGLDRRHLRRDDRQPPASLGALRRPGYAIGSLPVALRGSRTTRHPDAGQCRN